MLVIGVDGGGSKTRALVADADGRVLGAGDGPSCNHHGVGVNAAFAAVASTIDAAFDAAGIHDRADVAAAAFGLAGVDREIDRKMWHQILADRGIAPRIDVVNDIELVLAAGCDEGWGVALICGTGSIGFGRAPDGRTARAGGWGYILGDEGSGYSIAIAALRLATRTADGRAHAPSILDAALAHWGLESAEQLLGTAYRPDVTIAELAKLATRVVDLAEAGDLTARAILNDAARALAELVDAVVAPLSLDSPPVALAGGVLRASPFLRDRVLASTRTPLGPHRIVDDPAIGAVRLAQRVAAS